MKKTIISRIPKEHKIPQTLFFKIMQYFETHKYDDYETMCIYVEIDGLMQKLLSRLSYGDMLKAYESGDKEMSQKYYDEYKRLREGAKNPYDSDLGMKTMTIFFKGKTASERWEIEKNENI